MKTTALRFAALALFFVGVLPAQYFQQKYGTGGQDFLESGITLTANFPQGYAMTGSTSSSATIGSNLMVTRTDIAGAIAGAPSFNNAYPIFSSTGQVAARGRRIIELGTTTTVGQFAIFGDYNPPSVAAPTNFFYMLLNGNGTLVPGMPRGYSPLLTTASATVEATSITVSSLNPGNVYVCGNVTLSPTVTLPMIMCLQAATGNIVWGFLYRPPGLTALKWTATDLIESPYPSVSNAPEVFVVGRFDSSTNGSGDGCLFKVNGGTGAVISPLYLYGTTFQDEGLNSIDIASNTFGSGPGFIVSGFSERIAGPALFHDTWAMKLSANATVVDWSSVMHYTNGADNFGNDAIERLNTSNQYEYYVGGYAVNGVFGGDDAIVYKLNAGGGAVGGGQFSYGGQGNERAMQVGQYNNAATNGLSVFGTTQGSFPGLGATDFYNVKAYFNGITACSYDTVTPPVVPGPGIRAKVAIDISQQMTSNNLQVAVTPVNNVLICSAPFVIGGSNARMAHGEAATPLVEAKLFPNPVSQDHAVVTVAFDENVAAGEAEVELWNTLGQLCQQQKLSLAEGATQVDVPLGTGLAPGLYHFIIRYHDRTQEFQLAIQ